MVLPQAGGVVVGSGFSAVDAVRGVLELGVGACVCQAASGHGISPYPSWMGGMWSREIDAVQT